MPRLTAEIKWKYDTYFIQTFTVLPSSLVNSNFWTPKLIMSYLCAFIIYFSTVFEREYAIIRWFCCWSYECWKIYCSMSDNLVELMASIFKLFFFLHKSSASVYFIKVKLEIKNKYDTFSPFIHEYNYSYFPTPDNEYYSANKILYKTVKFASIKSN